MIQEEKKYLRQIQQDNAIHRDKHLQAQSYATRLATKTEEEKTKLDELKDKAVIIKQMRHRERQARAWKKISYATKKFTPMGVFRLGIPQGFDLHDTKGMWDYLQQPYVKPSWRYITDPTKIETILIKWQQHHYTQSNDTPLANPTWANQKDLTNISPQEVTAILNDNLEQDKELDPEAVVILQQIKENLIPTIPPHLSTITTSKFR